MFDANTGLPELPEGMFWRIKPSIAEYAHVEIRKKVWFFSVLKAYGVLRKSELTSRSEILTTAYYAMKCLYNKTDIAKVYGDYPPKKL